MNYFKFGEKRLTELNEIFKHPATTLDSNQKTILLSEIERALSGIWAIKQYPVDNNDYETVLPENDRKILIDIIKDFAPMRRTKKHDLTNTSLPIYELLFERLKSFGTEQGANSLIEQLLAKPKQCEFESAQLKSRQAYIQKELHIFYHCAVLLLEEEQRRIKSAPSNLSNLFKMHREDFSKRAISFSQKKSKFDSTQASEHHVQVEKAIESLSIVSEIYEYSKPIILEIHCKLLQGKLPLRSLTKASITSELEKHPRFKLSSTNAQTAKSIFENLETDGYINSAGILQPAYYIAAKNRASTKNKSTTTLDFIKLIETASSCQYQPLSFSEILGVFSKNLPEASPYNNLYLLLSILLAEKHLLSLFPDYYANIRKSTTCSEKNAHFFMFLHLYFSRKSYQKNILADELLWQCLSEVLESENFLTELRAEERRVKNSLEEHSIEEQYKDLLNDPNTLETLADRLRIYSEELIKIDNTSQLVNQPQLAKVLDCTQQQISKLINRKKILISPSSLVNISQSTGLGITYLLGLSDDPMAKPNGLSGAILKTPKFKVIYLNSRYKSKDLSAEDLRFLKFLRKNYEKRNRFKIKFKEPAQAVETKSK